MLILCQQETLESEGVRRAKTSSKHTQQTPSLSQGKGTRALALPRLPLAPKPDDFPKAIKTAERALQLATDQGNTALADAIPAQIRFYQSGFPYRYNSRPSISAGGTQQ